MKPIASLVRKTIRRNTVVLFACMVSILGFGYFITPATVWRMLVPQAQAATFTVTNTSDAGAGSLRAAVAAALSSPGADTINFNIPANDPRHFYYVNDGVAGTVTRSMIAVTSSSDDTSIGDIDPDWPHSWYSIETAGFVGGPLFSNTVTIDGLSQPGSVLNTNLSGALNSILRIELTNSTTNGSCSRIFHIAFEPVVLRGMIINGCSQSSSARLIDFDFASHGSIATGNYLGTDASGTVRMGAGYGVHIVQASNVRVGGNLPAERNLISGNFRGVYATSGGSSGASFSNTQILGNLIGTKRDGVSPLGNGFHPEQPLSPEDAIVLGASNGSTTDNRIENNVIAFNSRHGIHLASGGVGTGTSSFRNRFLNNSIHSNGNIGIQLDGFDQGGGSAVTPNDPCDADEGMNGLQNFPVIKSAVISGATVSIAGTFNSTPGRVYHLEFFASQAADVTYFGEGQTVLGTSTVVIAAGSCIGTFNVVLPLPSGAGNVITATATDASGNTSEFSAAYIAEPRSDSCALPSDGLVSWYSAQGNVNDSKSENHGRFIVFPPRYPAGHVGQAFEFGRNNADVIEAPDHPNLDFTNAFTLEMWVAPTEAGHPAGTTFFISKGDVTTVNTQSYAIMFTPDRKVVNRVGNSTTIDQLVSASAIPLNQFTHIATTYDGTTLRVYINGVPDASQSTSIGSLQNTSRPLAIGGAFFNGGYQSSIGAVDEPSLYNRALSDAEIAAIHGAGSAGKCKTSSPLVTRTWDGGGATNNWSEGANWTGDIAPAGSDDVVFDATSIKNAVVDIDFSIASLQINAGYTGMISIGSANLSLSGSYTQNAGTFNGGTGTLNLNSNFAVNGGTFNAESGNVAFVGTETQIVAIPDGLTLNNVVVNKADNTSLFFLNSPTTLIVAGTLALNDGRFELNSVANIDAQGSFTIGSGFDGGPLTSFRFTGAANQTYANNGGVNPGGIWRVNKPAGTVTAATNLIIANQDLAIQSGTLHLDENSDLSIAALSVSSGGKLVNNSSTTITLGGNVTNAGIIDLNGGGAGCPETDSILIRSSNATQRSWTGGRNRLIDVDVQNMGGTGTKTVYSGTNSGGNNATWVFDNGCLQALSITPSVAGVPAGEVQIFAAAGGLAPYTFTLPVNNSGATIEAATGRYTAGPTVGASDTVRVTDAFGDTVDATVTVVGAPTRLGFIVQPSNTSVGQTITPPVKVACQDANGNTVTTITPHITIAIANNPSSGTLSGTLTRQASFGVATFDNLSIDAIGSGYTLQATNIGLTTGTSNAFDISAGTPTQVAFLVEPSNVGSNVAISPSVRVAIRDAGGNIVTSATGPVTVAIGSNPGSSTLSGTLTKNAVAGIASFHDLRLNVPATGYTLTASSGILAGDTSAAFDVVNALIVTNTNDGGAGSLRQAIISSNATPGTDTITFAIPGPAPHTIELDSILPTILHSTRINGHSQPPGPGGAPRVQLRSAPGHPQLSTGFVVFGGNTTIAGLALGNFTRAIVLVDSGENQIVGNYIGIDANGSSATPNFIGIELGFGSSNNRVGNVADITRNVISGNSLGILVAGANNTVQGNYIGTNAGGTAAIGNGDSGLYISNDNNLVTGNVVSGNQTGIKIGASTLGNNNIIENNTVGMSADLSTAIPNAKSGIFVTGNHTGNLLSANRIFGNGAKGIKLSQFIGDSFSTLPLPNDPQDPDVGPNAMQNYPVLSAALPLPGGTTRLEGTLNSTPLSTYELQFFSSRSCDASGNGEGEVFIHVAEVTTDAGGIAAFSTTVFAAVPAGHFITATARDAQLNTSEFSNCQVVRERSQILGRVVTAAGQPISNVEVRLTNPQGPTFSQTTLTNSTGNYSFDFLPPADYTLTVVHPNLTFTPASRFYPNLTTNQTDQNFVAATPQAFTLRGTARTTSTASAVGKASDGKNIAMPPVPAGGFPLLGVNFNIVGPGVNQNVTNDSFGNYRFVALPPGTYTVTPTKSNYVFTPPAEMITVDTGDEAADFSGQSTDLSTLAGRIVYDSQGGIKAMNADGSGLVTLSPNSLRSPTRIQPRLSENGQDVVFASRSTTSAETTIVSMSADGTGRDLLYQTSTHLSSPVYSPDGSKIAFHNASESLVVMNADGTGVETIISLCKEPDWSPDGTQIVCVEESGGDARIKTVNLVSTTHATLDSSTGRKFSPRWSPDGTKIAFLRRQAGTPPIHSIVVKHLLGGTDSFLTGTNSLNQSLSWSPDGARLLVVRNAVAGSSANVRPPGAINQLVTIQSNDGQNMLVIDDSFDGFRIDWGKSNSIATPASPSPTTISTGAVSITFPTTTGADAFTTITPIEPNSAGTAPNGFVIGNFAFEISTTAGFTPPITICVDLDEPGVQSRQLRVSGPPAFMHNENGVLVNITTSYDEETRVLCGQTSSFSPFVLAEQVDPALPSIKGLVLDSNDNPMSGVSVILTGAEAGQTQTDSNGLFTFANLTAGANYNVQPQLVGYLFNEYSQDFLGVSGESTIVFTGTASAFEIAGKVVDGNGNPVGNATITLDGAAVDQTVTDVDGNYAFAGLPADGSYFVTPSNGQFSFSPSVWPISALTSDLDSVDFTQFAPTAAPVSVGGRIMSADGIGINSAVVTLTDAAGVDRRALSNPFGYYRFDDVMVGETYIVTVASKRYSFPNPSRVISVIDELNDIDFVALP